MKKPLSLQINVVGKVLGFWQQNMARFNIDIGGKGMGGGGGGGVGIWKIDSFLEFTGFSAFVSIRKVKEMSYGEI